MACLLRSWVLVWEVRWPFITFVTIPKWAYGFMYKALQYLEKYKVKSNNSITLYFCGSCSYLLFLGSKIGSAESSHKVLHRTWFQSSHWVYVSFKYILSANIFCLCFSVCIFNSSPGPLWHYLTMRIICLSDRVDILNSLVPFSLYFHLLVSTLLV